MVVNEYQSSSDPVVATPDQLFPLILPSGWYKPKRVVEVYVQQPLRARLVNLVDRGPDFERLTYEVLNM